MIVLGCIIGGESFHAVFNFSRNLDVKTFVGWPVTSSQDSDTKVHGTLLELIVLLTKDFKFLLFILS